MSKLAAALGARPDGSREITPYEKFRAQIERLRPELMAMTGKEGVDRFVRVCLNAVQANPATLAADRKSLVLACLRAAQDRLLPDGREAVLNIYKTKTKVDGVERWVEMVQYLPMVGGLIKKLYDSGHVTFVDAVAVRAKDEFVYERGDEPKIKHIPYAGEDDPGPIVAAYVVVKMKNGETKREVMFRREIETVRQASKAPNGLMWEKFYDQGAIKSVIKRAYKQIPNYYELDSVVAADNQATGIVVEGETLSSSSSMDLQQLVDGRVEAEARAVPAGTVQDPERREPAIDAAREAERKAEADATAATAKGTAETPTAKTGKVEKKPGTTDVMNAITEKMRTCTDLDTLAIIADDSNAFVWTPEEIGRINGVYHERVSALTADK